MGSVYFQTRIAEGKLLVLKGCYVLGGLSPVVFLVSYGQVERNEIEGQGNVGRLSISNSTAQPLTLTLHCFVYVRLMLLCIVCLGKSLVVVVLCLNSYGDLLVLILKRK